ncbi:MAG: tryptophan--tRNA ligase [Campylobacteraceae bacterium]|jgi:tryptophanyl-tRNA synthetase|nr:tryptophan--tRNA ligase [Campylobacteraceae bacterium]
MRTLTGIQPSGALHIGNYFGAIKQMLDLQKSDELFLFIPNLHALTTLKDAEVLRANTLDAAATLLSLGVEPNKTIFWVQSDVKEVLELYWILSAFTPMGLLERAHGYKDKIAKGILANHALFSYPVLMAADILLYSANRVPVGKDQIQHVEITRDIAIKFNNEYGDIFTIPEAKIEENLALVPGIDGAKMSKSYSNTIDIFLSEKELKAKVGKIVTDSTPMEEPKDPYACNIFALAKLFLDDKAQDELAARYRSGKEGYGHFKAYLKELIWDYFATHREKKAYYDERQDEIIDILRDGAHKAREIALPMIEKVRGLVGIYR